jgi:hypothetical protein
MSKLFGIPELIQNQNRPEDPVMKTEEVEFMNYVIFCSP